MFNTRHLYYSSEMFKISAKTNELFTLQMEKSFRENSVFASKAP